MPFQIIRNDITKVSADIIVNTANPAPVIGGGTDSAIYHAAGEEQLLAARREIGEIAPGSAAVTPAFGLSAKYIIHTVGPVWLDGTRGERDILRSCYAASLSLAAELSAESIAFPLIATGTYGFPREEALDIALKEIGKFLLSHEMLVTLVVFDRCSVALSADLMGSIDEYIDENGVRLAREQEYGTDRRIRERRRRMEALESSVFGGLPDNAPASPYPSPQAAPKPAMPKSKAVSVPEPDFQEIDLLLSASAAEKTLDDMLSGAGKTFQQKLFELIDERGLDDVTVYKNANIDRKVFSKIRCNAGYKPKKKTAVAFAIALKLDMPAMLDLLSRAEIAFSPASRFDLIITWFIEHGIYDIFEINAALFHYGEPILGE